MTIYYLDVEVAIQIYVTFIGKVNANKHFVSALS